MEFLEESLVNTLNSRAPIGEPYLICFLFHLRCSTSVTQDEELRIGTFPFSLSLPFPFMFRALRMQD